ncbi:hypothetical protein M5K25_007391 [Dendrobium thyrsiflorum]|uniref:Uncharacterized protein n=1 Tax=Dendrobium thyrsiflorum TaxID=117978 RepID=A0ABD0VLF6_DENTH
MVDRALTPLSIQVGLSTFGLNKAASISSSSSSFALANFNGHLLSGSFFGERTSHSFWALTISRKLSISSSTVFLSMLPTA